VSCRAVLQVLRRAAAYRVPLYVTETGVSIASEQERCYTIDAYVKEVGVIPCNIGIGW